VFLAAGGERRKCVLFQRFAKGQKHHFSIEAAVPSVDLASEYRVGNAYM
jgi:hypothetical protein